MAHRLRPLQLWISDRLYTASRRAGGRRILVMRHTRPAPPLQRRSAALAAARGAASGGLVRAAPRRLRAEGSRPLCAVPALAPGSAPRAVPARSTPSRSGSRTAILDAGGAVVNPVDQLSHSIKSVASARLRAAGVPMPRVAPISDARTLPEGLRVPGDRAGGPPPRRPDAPVPRRAGARERAAGTSSTSRSSSSIATCAARTAATASGATSWRARAARRGTS